MDKKNRADMPYSRAKQRVGRNQMPSNVAIVDQLGDEVFGIPPSLVTGLLTGLSGAAAGAVSLPIFFLLWEPDYYISPEWLIFVALGGIVGIFLRLEQPLFKDIYHYKARIMKQATDIGGNRKIKAGIGYKVDLSR
jgi:hypothetical protein